MEGARLGKGKWVDSGWMIEPFISLGNPAASQSWWADSGVWRWTSWDRGASETPGGRHPVSWVSRMKMWQESWILDVSACK